MATAHGARWGVLLVSGLVVTAAAGAQEPGDADLPSFASDVDREAYLRARADFVAERRGVPHFLPYDARARALAELEERERQLGVTAGPAWVEIGPMPIPNGQVSSGSSTVSGRGSPTSPSALSCPSRPSTGSCGGWSSVVTRARRATACT